VTEPVYAANFLKRLLTDGAKPSTVVLSEAKRAGITERTLWRGKRLAGVRSFRTKDRWFWRITRGNQ
jgi:hypothetical protein